jgi:hypothetical protein
MYSFSEGPPDSLPRLLVAGRRAGAMAIYALLKGAKSEDSISAES